MTPDGLVERVAEAMWMACDWGPMLKPYEEVRERDKRVIRLEARAAIAVALEEAARLAEAFPARTHGSLATAPYAAAEQAGEEIAAAIRAMIGKEPA